MIKVPYNDEDENRQTAQQVKAGKKSGGKKGVKEYMLTIEFIGELETTSLVKYVSFLASFSSIHRRCRAPEELLDAYLTVGAGVARSSEAGIFKLFSSSASTLSCLGISLY